MILQEYNNLKFTSPRFIAKRHPTLQNILVRSQVTLTDNQLIDMTLTMSMHRAPTTQPKTATLPPLRPVFNTISPCNHPRCITCRQHLTCSWSFKSNYPRNRTIYHIRHSFTCKSSNLVYLITCIKCKKQYVGCTTRQLNERITITEPA